MGIDNIPKEIPQPFQQRDVRRTPRSTQTQSQTIVAPIGAVLAWLKSFTNTPGTLPSGFVECNGQVLSDGDSVYDGQTLPDLNGDNQFLRGNSTSGGIGGDEAMVHTHGGTTGAVSSGTDVELNSDAPIDPLVTGNDHVHGFTTGGASNTENRPPFYNMVWIMRIK